MRETQSTPPRGASARLQLPRVVFGSSALGNLFVALPLERKLEIVRTWLAVSEGQIVIDSAGKYGAGLALECLGECLRELDVAADTVQIGVKLGWRRVPLIAPEPTFEPGAWVGLQHDAEQRISRNGIRECWEQALELLGEPYVPCMISVHDPDEYLAAASGNVERELRREDLRQAYDELVELRGQVPGCTLGVGAKDWRVAKWVAETASLDWVMLANCVTPFTHEPGVVEFIGKLRTQGVPVINSGVFNAGFLVGGSYFDYRLASEEKDPALFRWREAFLSLCEDHRVAPAHACILFGLSPPGVTSVALNSTDPIRIEENQRHAHNPLPHEFWEQMRRRGLIDTGYPYVDSFPVEANQNGEAP